MTELHTPPQIEEEIQRVLEALEAHEDTLEEYANGYAEAEAEYVKERAKAHLTYEGSQEARREHARLVTYELRLEKNRLEETLKLEYERGRDLRVKLDSLRTMAANARAAS